MIGFNGGLIGGLANARDTSALASQPGVWTLPEQRNAKLALLWPVVGGVVATVTGTVTTQDLNGYRIHTFTGNGNFIVTQEGVIDYLIVGGGGGGGSSNGGGGGAGGFREGTGLLATIADHSVVVGAAGAVNGGETPKPTGGASSVLGISAAGGGCGANYNAVGSAGGSGGGGSRDGGNPGLIGNTPPTSPAQGFAGGTHSGSGWRGGSGGGGAAGVGLNGGGNGDPTGEFAGDGGPGKASSISGSELYYAGGGGGFNNGNNSAANRGDGGIGGGGTGATAIQGGSPTSATAGATNRGGGGGGGNGNAGVGGSGVVIIRYPI